MKKQSISKPKILILAMAAGELTQGIALAKYAIQQGARVDFVLRLKENRSLLSQFENTSEIRIAPSTTSLKEHLAELKPDVFVLCNSKAVTYYKEFLERPPVDIPVTVTLDSNWLFRTDEDWYQYASWAQAHIIVFPEKVFQAGMTTGGGDYTIPEKPLSKMHAVGFLPSQERPSEQEIALIRKKYALAIDEKYIFSYFGGYGAPLRPWALENLIRAVAILIERGEKIRIINVTPEQNRQDPIFRKLWIEPVSNLAQHEFFLALASADLVFQHQGLGTLVQAVSAGIPVIANVMDAKDEPFERTAHAWEVGPFFRLGMCSMLYKSTPTDTVANEIHVLLHNKARRDTMIAAQKEYYEQGEAHAYNIITSLVNKHS
ncbi:glycosyltransferase [Patescibacteria group bacterium]|nr:glycosyltransferase [Patescibacteria group bacterium]